MSKCGECMNFVTREVTEENVDRMPEFIKHSGKVRRALKTHGGCFPVTYCRFRMFEAVYVGYNKMNSLVVKNCKHFEDTKDDEVLNKIVNVPTVEASSTVE